MRDSRTITIGKYQLTEAFIFTGFLSVAVSGFLLFSQEGTNKLWSVVAKTPTCQWDPTIPATVPQNLGPNLFSNPDLSQSSPTNDAPMGWQINSWGGVESKFSYAKNLGHNDLTSVKVEVNSASEGDAKWEQATSIPIAPQQSYLYRNYYQSDVPTYTIVEYTYQNNSRHYINLGVSPPSNDWKESSYTIVTPAESTHINLFHVITKPGYLITDDYRLRQYTSPPLPKGMISLTFDDGAKSIHSNALPLLTKYQLTSTQYVVTGPLKKPYNHYHISSEQLQDFVEAGHEIGSHTVNHRNLTEVGFKDLLFELASSQLDLYKNLGHTVSGFSTPYGSYSTEVLSQTKRYYCYHRSTDIGFNTPDSFDVYNIRVQNVEVATPVSQITSWIDYANEKKVWLVLVFHEIDTKNGMYSYTPENLEQVLAYLKSSSTNVVTVADGVKIMQASQKENELTR